MELRTTDTAGEAPAGSAPRYLLPPFVALGLGIGALQHAELLAAAAAELHIHWGVVVCIVLSVAALFNWAVFSINFRVARRPAARGPTLLLHPTATAGGAPVPAASASRSRLVRFMGLCLFMGGALHAEPLVAVAEGHQIHPAVVLAGAAPFHFAILSIHKSLARHQAGDELKRLPRARGLPLLPFVVLGLAIPTASSAQTVVAAGATDLPQDASVWALLALAVSFNIAIGSLYCFVIDGPPPAAAASVEPQSWSKAAGAIVSFITAAGVLVSCVLLASAGASGAIAARR